MSLQAPNADVPFDITRLSHVVLSSNDLDATRYFYETGLGLEVNTHVLPAIGRHSDAGLSAPQQRGC